MCRYADACTMLEQVIAPYKPKDNIPVPFTASVTCKLYSAFGDSRAVINND